MARRANAAALSRRRDDAQPRARHQRASRRALLVLVPVFVDDPQAERF